VKNIHGMEVAYNTQSPLKDRDRLATPNLYYIVRRHHLPMDQPEGISDSLFDGQLVPIQIILIHVFSLSKEIAVLLNVSRSSAAYGISVEPPDPPPDPHRPAHPCGGGGPDRIFI
jgi:hypothetical protein